MLTAAYNPWLVTLSVIIAVIASFTALSLAERVTASSSRLTNYWLAGGAISMGIGIWAMHFIGMLAFHLPIPIAYDVTLTVVSGIPAILASGVALFEIHRGSRNLLTLIIAALVMGGGISAMHYTGMAAMRMSPPISYDPLLFLISIIIAIGASMTALEIAYYLQSEGDSRYAVPKKIVSSLVMGAAIAGMHYTGMAAANFVEGSVCLASPRGIDPTWLAILVGAGSLMVLMMTLMVSVFDARLADQNARMVEKLSKANQELNHRAEELAEAMTSELRASANKDQLLRTLIGAIPDLVWLKDPDGVYLTCNPRFERFFGARESDIIGKTDYDFVDKELADFFRQHDKTAMAAGNPSVNEERVTYADDGHEELLETVKTPVRDSDDQLIGVLGVARDITERKHIENRLRTLSQAIEQSPVSVVITDPDARVEYVNGTFERVSGYRSAEIIGQHTRKLQSGKTPQTVYEELWQCITNGKAWQGEFQNRKKNGELYWEHAHIAPVLDDSGETIHYLAVKEDISLRKQQEEHILHQAHFDSLTDLPNRFLSLDRLSQLLNEARRTNNLVAVLFLDLDDFKKVNDTMGHDTGDKLLVEAASRLHDMVRSGDTVGRLGGDEFILLLGGITHAADASQVAESLLDLFRDPFCIDGRELLLTASVGIAVYPNDGDNSTELLRNADSAMYHSKGQGRNTYSYFNDSMNKDVSRRLLLEEQMHAALGRGEFSICYQPQINIDDRSIVSIEALLRWDNPSLGEVSPDEFIPIAEQTGLIVPIGEYVLSEAIGMAARWQQRYGQGFTTAINLSPRQFRDPNLVPFIEKTMQQTGIAGKSLELEITEGVLMSGHVYIERALTSLNAIGVGIAMDDFGTGYSSLSYLRSYPFDTLKIDRSFISDITVDQADLELVIAAIAMAHGLSLKVVAEGVETEEQLELLAAQGCDYAQGNLFSKPVSPEEITLMFEKQGQGLSE
ncbi:MAG: EAL domain-containing protein [Gammaproteobacteria bacterium]|nr:EAL domain-containing protein [Gammaproteobacteria bacterium]